MEQVGDFLVYTTSKRQLMKMRLLKEKSEDFGRISYLTIPFHRHKMTAVATCMKQPILVTAASDKTLMVWHFTTHPGSLSLQIVKQLPDVIQAVAVHPSGFYIVVAHLDRVVVYTVHPEDVAIANFAHHDIRGCTEIQFSNGGHLYALNDDDHKVKVFKFWSNECPPQWVFTGHASPIKSIWWLEDDTGLVSTGRDDHQVILWKLKPDAKGECKVWAHKQPLTQFSDCQIREEEPEKQNLPMKIVAIVASRDGSLREIENGLSRTKYEAGFQYS